MLQNIIDKWIIAPKVRLNCRLPWGAKKIGQTYAGAVMMYFLGSMIPVALLIVSLSIAVQHAPLLVLSIIGTDTKDSLPLILGVTGASFVLGFGLELWYINRQMRSDGLSLSEVVGLNLNSLNGSPVTAIKFSVIALLIGLVSQSLLSMLPIHPAQQAVAQFAGSLRGLPLLGFICLAGVVAPVFEELIFRGFLFNALRAACHNGRVMQTLFSGNSKFADWMAICGSSVVFAGAHLEPTAFIHLFVLGVILAELYRRSGSLICPMLLHSLNNLFAVAVLLLR